MKRLCLIAALLFAAMASAQYPSKPVRLVVPYAPGGGTDIMSRQLAQELSKAWGQNVFVENRAGANGIVRRAEPIASTPDDVAKFSRSEHDKFAKLVKAANIQRE